jgi:hypothetical protein
MGLTDALLDAFADAIQRSRLGPEILGPEWLPGGRFVQTFDPVIRRAFRTVGFTVEKERDNPWFTCLAEGTSSPTYFTAASRLPVEAEQEAGSHR